MLCSACKVEKPESEFYARMKVCKLCRCDQVRQYRLDHIEQVRAYDRERGSLAHRIEARRNYRQTPGGRDAVARAHQSSVQRHPARRAAQLALGNAVRSGAVVPWPVCAVPECGRKPEAHHPDYGQPLSVVWLCPAHHKQVHAMARRLEAGQD